MAVTPRPYEELSIVRLRVQKTDDKGRPVAAGAKGTIVHVPPLPPDREPGYIVEIVLFNAQGVHDDSHLIDVCHSEIEKV